MHIAVGLARIFAVELMDLLSMDNKCVVCAISQVLVICWFSDNQPCKVPFAKGRVALKLSNQFERLRSQERWITIQNILDKWPHSLPTWNPLLEFKPSTWLDSLPLASGLKPLLWRDLDLGKSNRWGGYSAWLGIIGSLGLSNIWAWDGLFCIDNHIRKLASHSLAPAGGIKSP